MTTLEVLNILAEIISEKDDLRGVITYHGEEEGTIMLVDFSNCGEPLNDNAVFLWSKQKDLTDENGNYRGTDEIDYGTFKTYAESVFHVLSQIEGTDNEFHAETF